MHEPDAIWEAMHASPVNGVNKWLKERYISELGQPNFVLRSNYTMAEGAELDRRNARDP